MNADYVQKFGSTIRNIISGHIHAHIHPVSRIISPTFTCLLLRLGRTHFQPIQGDKWHFVEVYFLLSICRIRTSLAPCTCSSNIRWSWRQLGLQNVMDIFIHMHKWCDVDKTEMYNSNFIRHEMRKALTKKAKENKIKEHNIYSLPRIASTSWHFSKSNRPASKNYFELYTCTPFSPHRREVHLLQTRQLCDSWQIHGRTRHWNFTCGLAVLWLTKSLTVNYFS